MIARLRQAFRRLLRRDLPPLRAGGRVVYEVVACRECGRTNAVRDGLCWFHRTGNEPVETPMTWDG